MKSKIIKHEKLEAASKTPALFLDIKELIERVRKNVVTTVNSQVVLLYWNIGNRIQKETLKDKRADYGKQVIENLSAALTSEFGAGFSKQNLFAFVRFAQVFPEYQIVSTLSGQFDISHFAEYFTELPSKKVLINKLNDAIKTARILVSQRAN